MSENADELADDLAAIRAIIARQFASLSWSRHAPADWSSFLGDFVEGALLYPAARPTRSQSVTAFVDRMKTLSGTTLRSFHETVLGCEIRIFGNIAVAAAAVEITENNADVSRSVEMMLLVKSDGAWRIASQAWDKASPDNPIPESLLHGGRDGTAS
ncbi:MAG: hypothetical protein K2Z80_26215 [Xanthobacteraceae bacterium]|nr:hypothetical protein [Xanthobacteraceae bacterium]